MLRVIAQHDEKTGTNARDGLLRIQRNQLHDLLSRTLAQKLSDDLCVASFRKRFGRGGRWHHGLASADISRERPYRQDRSRARHLNQSRSESACGSDRKPFETRQWLRFPGRVGCGTPRVMAARV